MLGSASSAASDALFDNPPRFLQVSLYKREKIDVSLAEGTAVIGKNVCVVN